MPHQWLNGSALKTGRQEVQGSVTEFKLDNGLHQGMMGDKQLLIYLVSISWIINISCFLPEHLFVRFIHIHHK